MGSSTINKWFKERVMRKKRLAKNITASLIYQITALVCAFILPKLFLLHFGSEVNGLVTSISQFLGVISVLELGVGAVVQSALYKPLAYHDVEQISKIMVSANRFFHRLARILFAYVLILLILYPMIAQQNFGVVYVASLIAAISISSFAQYYFGIVNALLLNADQLSYIQYNLQTITVILNTVVCTMLISADCSVQIVKLVTSLIYLLRPIVLRIYVKQKYQINWKIKYNEEPIQQKWNGVAQHLAAVVLEGTDMMVLTIFSTLSNVSIYAVYNLVINGVMTLFTALFNGLQAFFGELFARDDKVTSQSSFEMVEWLTHAGMVWFVGCVWTLIIPFVRVYTYGVFDAEYIQPLFALIIVLATVFRCLRIPYNTLILAAGHYKQTQGFYMLTASINLISSIVLVKALGLVGVAIGTLLAMVFHLLWSWVYVSRNLIKTSLREQLKLVFVDICVFSLGIIATKSIELKQITYYSWVLLAIKKAVIWAGLLVVVEYVFYKRRLREVIRIFSAGLKPSKV